MEKKIEVTELQAITIQDFVERRERYFQLLQAITIQDFVEWRERYFQLWPEFVEKENTTH